MKKKSKKKKETRGRKTYQEILDIDGFYKAINEAQVTNKPVYVYFSDLSLCSMIENILKDSDIQYQKKEQAKKVIYRLFSDRQDKQNSDVEADLFEEEIFIFDEKEL